MALRALVSSEAVHEYHADAYVLSADLQQPVQSKIEQQGLVNLPPDGTYTYQPVPAFNIRGVLSYRSGYTQVAGHRSPKGHGFTTLATSVVEDLNVLDVVTADRVVGQISTEHPVDGQVPSVTFLGTRFVNLRIGGHRVEIDQDIHILGPKPAKDKSYFEDSGVLSRMSQQYTNIRKAKNLPDWADKEFRWDKGAVQRDGTAACSLVNRVSGAPGASFGHVIDVPHFGKIYLGELSVDRVVAKKGSLDKDLYTFHLKMIRLEMGCIGTGNTTVVAMDSNGQGSGGGPHK